MGAKPKANGKANGKAIKSEPNGNIVVRSVPSRPKKSSFAKWSASWVSWYGQVEHFVVNGLGRG